MRKTSTITDNSAPCSTSTYYLLDAYIHIDTQTPAIIIPLEGV